MEKFTISRSRLFAALLIGFAVIVVLIVYIAMKSGTEKTAVIVTKPDLLDHPIYAKYRFNNADSMINIGTQPNNEIRNESRNRITHNA